MPDIEVKVDIGSPYTVVGAQNRKLDAVLKEHLRTVGIDGRTAVEDASGNPIGLKEKAILGMDILTVFDFKYHRSGAYCYNG